MISQTSRLTFLSMPCEIVLLTNPKSKSTVQVKVHTDDWVFIKVRFSNHPASWESFKEARYSNISKTKDIKHVFEKVQAQTPLTGSQRGPNMLQSKTSVSMLNKAIFRNRKKTLKL